jgi:hypothetical protein
MDKAESPRLRNTDLVISFLEGDWRLIVHGKASIVIGFTSHHGMGGKTVETDTSIAPTSILVAAMPVSGSR